MGGGQYGVGRRYHAKALRRRVWRREGLAEDRCCVARPRRRLFSGDADWRGGGGGELTRKRTNDAHRDMGGADLRSMGRGDGQETFPQRIVGAVVAASVLFSLAWRPSARLIPGANGCLRISESKDLRPL